MAPERCSRGCTRRRSLACGRGRWLLALPLIWLALAARAGALVEGELGRWLETTAAELGATLSRHPRFAGETVRLVTLTTGASDGRSNELAEAVENRLRQHLLGIDGVRLAVAEPRRECEPPRRIGYLLRVEVGAAGGRDGRVHIAVVDVAESVWVGGISHEWQGRLSAAQRAALARRVQRGVPGTPGSPIPLENAEAVALAIKRDLACTLPRELDGAVHVPTPAEPALGRVSLALQSKLLFEPLAALTPDRTEARWLLTLEPGPADGDADVRELNLTLADPQGTHRQRVASVFVSGHPARAPDEPSVAGTVSAPAAPRPAPAWLSPLEMRPAPLEGACDHRTARLNSCVEVSFELLEPAFLFVLSTRDHRVVEQPCEAAPARAEPGPRRYRLRVPPGRYAVEATDSGPDAGIYVLATQERRVARRLARALAAGPGRCGAGGRPLAADWLRGLERVLTENTDRILWRALHVAHDSNGIVAL